MPEPKVTRKYTIEEYLEIDEKSELRCEYRNGEIFTMAGASGNHIRISQNLNFQLASKFESKGSNCESFGSDMRVHIFRQNAYYYPDVVVSCQEVENENPKFLTAPVLIAEVLSDSTAAKDMTEKMLDYFQLPSLQYYLLISQDTITIYLHERTDIGWGVRLFTDIKDEIFLAKMDISILVKEIYKRVYWENSFNI